MVTCDTGQQAQQLKKKSFNVFCFQGASLPLFPRPTYERRLSDDERTAPLYLSHFTLSRGLSAAHRMSFITIILST